MTVRELPVAEWPRLAQTDLGQSVPYLLPEKTTILVVEEADEMIGCWAVLTIPHAEGLWIHPRYRGKTSVARKLWTAMQRTVTAMGFSRVQTGACDAMIAALLERHGATKLQMDSYILPVKG
jgi:Acetyltransferase (GNAT) family